MSEINSIANGTFTIGQTSTTNFQAGPGIKIDSPSEGTVRIGNDETVLYDDPTNHNVATTAEFVMSETLWNFHRALIEFVNMEFTNQPLNMEIDLDVSTTDSLYFTPMRNGNTFPIVNIPFANFYINSDGNIKYTNRGLLYDTWSNIKTTTADSRGYRVRKVIGIGRISGSNA